MSMDMIRHPEFGEIRTVTKKGEPWFVAQDVCAVLMRNNMDNPAPVIARVTGSFDNAPEHEIIRHIYPVIEAYRSLSLDAIREELNNGYGLGLIATDPDAIFEAVGNGNAATLYIGNHYSLENKVSAGMVERIEKDNGDMRLNDLLHLLIRDIQNVGGSIVFAPDEMMEYYNGIALINRMHGTSE